MRLQRGEAAWRREVEGWRASGKGAEAYAKGRGYSVSSLRRWAALETVPRAPAFVRLQVVGGAPTQTSELVVAVGGAEIRVVRGFDGELLRSVVEALSGGVT